MVRTASFILFALLAWLAVTPCWAGPSDAITGWGRGGGVEERLAAAITEGNLMEVRRLLAESGEVDMRMEAGHTPLFLAFMAGQDHVTQHLLDQGADVNARDENGVPLLHYAVHAKDIPATRLLLDYGANPDIPGPSFVTPLMLAAGDGQPHLVRLLLMRGARAGLKDVNGHSVCFYALYGRHPDVISVVDSYCAGEIDP